MTDKFDIKDYFNYSISGLLWLVIIFKLLDMTCILEVEDVFKFNQLNNSGLYITLILLLGTYIIGNLFRFTEKVIIFITNKLYGDFYSSALCTDRNKYLKSNAKTQILRLGLCYYLFKKKPLGIGKSASTEIEKNLEKLKILNRSKKNQYLMSETYLVMNYSKLKYERLKNLKNFYESISFPLFVLTFWLSNAVICTERFEWYFKKIFMLVILFIIYQFVDRYRYLKSNYIKDIYRYFLFEMNKN